MQYLQPLNGVQHNKVDFFLFLFFDNKWQDYLILPFLVMLQVTKNKVTK